MAIVLLLIATIILSIGLIHNIINELYFFRYEIPFMSAIIGTIVSQKLIGLFWMIVSSFVFSLLGLQFA